MCTKVEDLVEKAERCSADHSSLTRIAEELERRLHEEWTPELCYACAYVWYLHPGRLGEHQILERVDDLLRSVLDNRPDDYLSLLYLGHNSYDRGDYGTARRYFESAREFATSGYIGLKSFEMTVCCDVMLKGVGGALGALRDFVIEASGQGYAPEDIWPRELVAALGKGTAKDLSSEQAREAKELAERLDQLGCLGDWVSTAVQAVFDEFGVVVQRS